jgi:uncharacterized protein YegL
MVDINITGKDMAKNPENRCPCVLVLDTSGSMSGAIDELNQGIERLRDELNEDTAARKRVEIAIVTFGGTAEVVQDFVTVDEFVPPRLEANGLTPMGSALNLAIKLVEERKEQYKQYGRSYYRPWIFLLTDGTPEGETAEEWQAAVSNIQQGQNEEHFVFFPIGCGDDVDMDTLSTLSGPGGRKPAYLRNLAFEPLFVWLSQSLREVSGGKPGDKHVSLPPRPAEVQLDWSTA